MLSLTVPGVPLDMVREFSKLPADLQIEEQKKQPELRTIPKEQREAVSKSFALLVDDLSELHEKGMCHGDFSFKNILLAEDGTIALIDFGGFINCDPDGRVYFNLTETPSQYGNFLPATNQTISSEDMIKAERDVIKAVAELLGDIY